MTDYAALTDKRVTIVTGGKTLEGEVTAGSPVGVVFRPKGSAKEGLIMASDIESIEELVPGPKKLKARTIPQVTDGKHREHLIERHGYKVSEINALSEADAKAFHDGIDHTDLGHKHRELTEAERAIQAAAEDNEADAA